MHYCQWFFIFALFIGGKSLWCMQETLTIKPLALMVKRAAWTKDTAPHAFDEHATTLATRTRLQATLLKEGSPSSFICSKGEGCALSSDGFSLGLPGQQFKQDMISLWGIESNKERVLRTNGPVGILAISNKSSGIVAYIEQDKPELIKFSNFPGAKIFPNLQIDNHLCEKLALGPDGNVLAAICRNQEYNAERSKCVVYLIDLNTRARMVSISSHTQEIVNLALGKNLILELEDSYGNRWIKTIALLNNTLLTPQQIPLIDFLHLELDKKRDEGAKAMIALNNEQRELFDSLPEIYQDIIVEVANFSLSDLQ